MKLYNHLRQFIQIRIRNLIVSSYRKGAYFYRLFNLKTCLFGFVDTNKNVVTLLYFQLATSSQLIWLFIALCQLRTICVGNWTDTHPITHIFGLWFDACFWLLWIFDCVDFILSTVSLLWAVMIYNWLAKTSVFIYWLKYHENNCGRKHGLVKQVNIIILLILKLANHITQCYPYFHQFL